MRLSLRLFRYLWQEGRTRLRKRALRIDVELLARNTLEVAEDLLGKKIIYEGFSGMMVER